MRTMKQRQTNILHVVTKKDFLRLLEEGRFTGMGIKRARVRARSPEDRLDMPHTNSKKNLLQPICKGDAL